MISSIIEQSLLMLPLIMGAYITLSLLKVPNFSLESAYLFGGVAAYLSGELQMPLVILAAMGGGMTVGLTVSIFNQILKVPYLLAAIVTNGLYHGVTQYLLDSSSANIHVTAPVGEIPLLLITNESAVALFACLLRSQLGYSFAIYGNNPRFFANHRVSEKFVLTFGIMTGHALAGVSGFLFAHANGFIDLTMNYGIILMCLTALMIGKLAFRAYKPNSLTPLLGITAFFIIQQSLLCLGLNLKYFNAFQALFVLSIVVVGYRKKTIHLDHLGV